MGEFLRRHVPGRIKDQAKEPTEGKYATIYASVDAEVKRLTRDISLMPFGRRSRRIRADWNEITLPWLIATIPSTDRLTEILDAEAKNEAGTFPGLINFQSDVDAYFGMCSVLYNRRVAKKVVSHELEHKKVLEENGVRADLVLIFARRPDNSTVMKPMVAARYPTDMPQEERLRIEQEVSAVRDESFHDPRGY